MSSVYVLDSDEFDLDSDSSCSSSSFDGAEGSLLPEVNAHDPFSDPKTRSRLVSSHKIREWIEDITPIEDIPPERRKSLRAELLNNLDTTTDWNIIFQELLDITVQTPHEKQMKIKMINKLSVTFASFAQPHLIEALKKQLRDPSIGGLAGGEKHIIGNLFLKEATNNREVNGKTIYTDNINSAKSAEHELKSLRSIISTGVKNLNFPLMVLVYYLGRCFTCQSLLPINEYSIVFGSDDGSKTFHNRNPEVYELIQATCKSLNLRPRAIKTKDGVFNIACPFDLEAHVSFDDQRSYVLDPARLFPPIPELKAKDDHLCKLFRPEFVRKYRKPLNPDAFSNARWASAEEKQECIDDLREAYAFLLNDVVKGLARNLEERFGFDDDHANRSFDAKQDLLSFEAHSVGLNIRYLGLLRSNIVRSKNLRRYILAELIARAQNRIMRQELFKIDIKSDKQVFRQVALDLMNKLFTSDPQIRKTYWNERLKPTLVSAYEGSLSKEEDLEDFDYSVEIPRRWFWRRTIHHCGTKVDTVSAKAFMLREPLVLEDLQLIFKVKYINIESLANTTEDFSAVEHFNKNLGRRARVLPADSPHVLADVMNLANALVREESKDNEKIMFVLQKMKDSCQSEKLVMKDPYNVARMLSLIADIERDRANFDEASVYIQHSIQIRKQFLKSLDENINSAQHIIVIEALFSQGLIECARQNSKVARDLFSFILASIKNKEVNGFTDFDALQGKCSNMFFRSSLELALLVMEDNNFFLAEKLLTKAHRLLLSTPHPSEIHLSTITNRLAICALLQNRMKEAEKCANESLEIRLEFYGSNNEKFAHALVLISFVYYFYRNFDQAEELLLNSKRIYESCNTPRFFAMVNANLARFYHKKARMEPQMKQQLLEKSKALLLERKDKRYGTISDLAAVYYELGQQQEAIAMIEQAKNVIKNKSKPLGDYFQLIEDALRGNDGDLVFKLTERLTFESATIYIEMVYSRIDEFDTKKELESAKKRIDKSHRKFTNSKKKLSECFLHRSNSIKEGVNSIISKYSDILQSDTFSSPLDILLYDVPKLSIAEDYTRPIYFIKIDDDSSIHGSHSTQFKIGKKLFTAGDVDLCSSTEALTYIDKDELRKELEPYAEIFLLVVGIGFHLSDALKQVYMMTSSKADDSNFIINQPVIVFYWPLSSYMIEWVKSPKLNGFVRKSHIEQYAKTAGTIADSLLDSMLMLDSFSKSTNIMTYNVGADLLLRAFEIRSKRGISEVPFHGYNKVLMLEPFSQNDLFSRVLHDYDISFEANLTIYKCVQDATLQSALLMAQVDADPILVRIASSSPAVSATIDVERLSINMKDKNNWHLCKHILRDLYCAINGISFKDPRRVYESSSNLVGLIELNRNAHSFGLRSSQH